MKGDDVTVENTAEKTSRANRVRGARQNNEVPAVGRAGGPGRGGRHRAGRVRRRVELAARRQPGNQHQLGDDQQRQQRGQRELVDHPAEQQPDPAAGRVGHLHARHGDPNQADPTIDANKVIH